MPVRLVYLPGRHQIDYLTEHVRRSLRGGERSVLLVTASQSARRLWDYFTASAVDTRRLHILDVVSSPLLAQARADNSHLTYLGNPMALETMILQGERIARRLPRPVRAVVHTLNAFCLYNSSETLEEAIRHVLREVADPDLLLDLLVEQEGGVYRDLETYLRTAADYRTNLGPRLVPAGTGTAPPETMRP